VNLRGQPDRPFVLEEFNGTVTWAINLNEVLSYQTWEHDKEAWPLTHDSKKKEIWYHFVRKNRKDKRNIWKASIRKE